MAGAPALAFAAGDTDDDLAGQLNLDTTVLVNESGGAGSTGDFVIRGALFSDDLAAHVEAQDWAAAQRLHAADALDFAAVRNTEGKYQPVRDGLFEEYASTGTAPTERDDAKSSEVLLSVAVVLGVSLVLGAGVLLGRFVVRRKKAAS